MNNFWLSILLPTLLPIVTGYLTTGSMQALKKLSSVVDNLPTYVKPIVVFVIATAITLAAKALGLQIDATSLAGLSSTDVQSILGALVAIALHNSKKLGWTQVAVDSMATNPAVVNDGPTLQKSIENVNNGTTKPYVDPPLSTYDKPTGSK